VGGVVGNVGKWALALSVCAAAACAGGGGSTGTGNVKVDAGTPDSGPGTDAGPDVDGGTDAGTDAGPPDAGPTDGGTPDAGPKFGGPGPWPIDNVQYGSKDGIQEMPVVGVTTDETQNLWVATHSALYLLRPGERKFTRFDGHQGLHLPRTTATIPGESTPPARMAMRRIRESARSSAVDPTRSSSGITGSTTGASGRRTAPGTIPGCTTESSIASA
jgi:hypothetical protein